MKFTIHDSNRRAMSLVEIMIATAIGGLVLAGVASLSMYGARSSVALVNYTDLDSKSRYAADWISEEMRQSTGVTAFQTNLPVKSLTLTNRVNATSMTLTYDSNARTLSVQKAGLPAYTALTECDRWDFGFYQRTPLVTTTNLLFYPATNNVGQLDLRLCKLVNLSWKCSRTILAQKVNTETVQAAQLVLRNKM